MLFEAEPAFLCWQVEGQTRTDVGTVYTIAGTVTTEIGSTEDVTTGVETTVTGSIEDVTTGVETTEAGSEAMLLEDTEGATLGWYELSPVALFFK